MSNIRREILAGLSTFFTVAYYFLLYPKILSEGGLDFGSALTATILTLVLSTIFLALYTKTPYVLGPGISVAAYLVYSVVLKQHATWQAALGIVFWTGLAMFLLSIFKVRQKLIHNLPPSLISAAIGGVGLFLICVGLKDLGILIPDSVTFYRLGAILTPQNGIALFGVILFFVLNRFRIPGSFLVTIISCWIFSLLFGFSQWQGVLSSPPSLSSTFFQLDILTPLQPRMWGFIFSALLISLLDSTAAMTALSKLSHNTDERGRIKNLQRLVIPDGIGGMLGSFLGAANLTFFLESSSGIKAGGRTAITALTAALCSLAVLFLYPLVSSIPSFASVPALIAIGVFMTVVAKEIHWHSWTDAVPSLITLLIIPLTFSIYRGFAIGFLSYILLKAITNRGQQVHPICWGLGVVFALHIGWMTCTGS